MYEYSYVTIVVVVYCIGTVFQYFKDFKDCGIASEISKFREKYISITKYVSCTTHFTAENLCLSQGNFKEKEFLFSKFHEISGPCM